MKENINFNKNRIEKMEKPIMKMIVSFSNFYLSLFNDLLLQGVQDDLLEHMLRTFRVLGGKETTDSSGSSISSVGQH